MRISDWSSDVCSSDLLFPLPTGPWPCKPAAQGRRKNLPVPAAPAVASAGQRNRCRGLGGRAILPAVYGTSFCRCTDSYPSSRVTEGAPAPMHNHSRPDAPLLNMALYGLTVLIWGPDMP